MAQHDMDSADVRDQSAGALRFGTVEQWQAEQERRPFIPASEIAAEIVSYLPNPGQYQQVIIAAHPAEDGTVELSLINGQFVRLQIVTEPSDG